MHFWISAICDVTKWKITAGCWFILLKVAVSAEGWTCHFKCVFFMVIFSSIWIWCEQEKHKALKNWHKLYSKESRKDLIQQFRHWKPLYSVTGQSNRAETQDVVSGPLKLFIIAVPLFHLKPPSFLGDLILQRPSDFHHPISYSSHMVIMMTWPALKTLHEKKDIVNSLHHYWVQSCRIIKDKLQRGQGLYLSKDNKQNKTCSYKDCNYYYSSVYTVLAIWNVCVPLLLSQLSYNLQLKCFSVKND